MSYEITNEEHYTATLLSMRISTQLIGVISTTDLRPEVVATSLAMTLGGMISSVEKVEVQSPLQITEEVLKYAVELIRSKAITTPKTSEN